ncbi:unnamed protein product [Thelazia callipaeda]|uniref:Apple domain-containing protein n=1 Tax=Thelazia callipaeda TaxID=103827 RepID=A0A0N5D4A3_THECL|nr:unnamed protein product [Thelazia callipaeda]
MKNLTVFIPECANDQLLVYVNATELDRKKYEIERKEADSLLECTKKCYENPRCTSLKYREADSDGCSLTTFTPVSCYHITLVPVAEIKYDPHTLITIECLKCQAKKDFDPSKKSNLKEY